jgi:hypothetical protein
LSQLIPDKDDILVVTSKEIAELENILRGLKCKARAAWHIGLDSNLTKKMGELNVDDKSKADIREEVKCFVFFSFHYLY